MKKLLIILMFCIALVAAVLTTGMAVASTELSINAASAYLVEYNTGTVLYEKNADDKKPIASMVKIMTLLMAFEAVDAGQMSLDEKITVSHTAASQKGSELFLDANTEYCVSDLIKGIVVVSANDAAVAIAERLAGSESAFCQAMNHRASELLMENTKFANATGYPTEQEQYSTAKDVSRMTRELLKHKAYYDYSGVWLEDFVHPSGRVTQLANTNKLVRHYKGCDSGKTGYTDAAKHCLSASAARDGMRLVSTVLGGQDSKARFAAASTLFNYGFANYRAKVMLKAQESCDQSLKVAKSKIRSICPVASRDLVALINKGSKEWRIEYEFEQDLKAPLAKGQTVGVAYVVVDGERVDSVPMLSPCDVEKAGFWDSIQDIGNKF